MKSTILYQNDKGVKIESFAVSNRGNIYIFTQKNQSNNDPSSDDHWTSGLVESFSSIPYIDKDGDMVDVVGETIGWMSDQERAVAKTAYPNLRIC